MVWPLLHPLLLISTWLPLASGAIADVLPTQIERVEPHAYDPSGGKKQWYNQKHRKWLLQGCGDVCNISIRGAPGRFFDHIRKHFDCVSLYRNTYTDAAARLWPPPSYMPVDLHMDFLVPFLTGHRSVYLEVYADGHSTTPETAIRWTEGMVNRMIAQAGSGLLQGSYLLSVTSEVRAFMQKHSGAIAGRSLLVVGSRTPWLESLLLWLGAAKITTVEYTQIISEHPLIETMTPSDLRRQFLASAGAAPRFDGVVSFSSVEHAGLGRYGDMLNPWGDLQAIAKAWCVTRPGGMMFLGVPTAATDELIYNTGRIYRKRYAHLTANWHQVDKSNTSMYEVADRWGQFQPMLLFQRLEDTSSLSD